MLLFGLTPFEAWILLIACSLIPTVCIYLVLSRVQASSAALQGNIGGLAVKLGGPVAFYAVLLWLGRTYIPGPEVPLFVTLIPSPDARDASLNLVEGSYKYNEPMSDGGVKSSEGRVEVTLGYGGWQAKLPQVVLSKAVELTFKDQNGTAWRVHAFYPNYNRQELVKTPGRPTGGLLRERPAPGGVLAVGAAHAAAAESPVPPLTVIAQKEAPLKFENYARPMGGSSGRPFYQWRVFLDEPPSVLATIAQVQYLLHPTFPEPFQVRTDARTYFALDASGWGSFYILITVRYKDGNEQKLSYYLDLSKKWPN
jgi:hypothetical protein